MKNGCWTVCVSQLSPFFAAKQVLGHFRYRFIRDVDANAIAVKLREKGIISSGDLRLITKTANATQQNQTLHKCLEKNMY